MADAAEHWVTVATRLTEARVNELALVLTARGVPSWAYAQVDDIVAHLSRETRSGDVVVVFSNGSFGGLHQKLMQRLGSEEAS